MTREGFFVIGADSVLKELEKDFGDIEDVVDVWALDTAEKVEQRARDIIRRGGSKIYGRFEPNAPSTVRRKGSAKPLIDTGDMMDSITSRRTGKGKAEVGLAGSENNLKAIVNENPGVRQGEKNRRGTPSRKFMEPAAIEIEPKALKDLERRISKVI